MFNDRIEAKWIDTFVQAFDYCKVKKNEEVAILSETQSRQLNVHLAELALLQMGARPFHVILPTPPQRAPVSVRSTGTSDSVRGLGPVIKALNASSMVVDLTVEGMLHAPELNEIIKDGARLLMISNEHPEALERLLPDPELTKRVKAGVKLIRATKQMTVTSSAGTDLRVDMTDAPCVGVWGYCDRPGTVAHWPGGIIVAFPLVGTVQGRIVMDVGDINLTFKRYLEHQIVLTLEDDYITKIEGNGTDSNMFRRYLEAWDDKEAYGTSHVGWGMNEGARYEALTMYDKRDTNGTELRAYAGNFLYSTGANEYAKRHTLGHFDLPIGNCTIKLDGESVVEEGNLMDVFS
jgi:2,5-dihydroxypyridine 5,6-dioxygenase